MLANDWDRNGDPVSIEGVANGTHGTAEIVNGQILYTPEAGFNGIDTFTYTATDNITGSETANVTVSVGAPSFEGAVGFGAYATGGRGGQVVSKRRARPTLTDQAGIFA